MVEQWRTPGGAAKYHEMPGEAARGADAAARGTPLSSHRTERAPGLEREPLCVALAKGTIVALQRQSLATAAEPAAAGRRRPHAPSARRCPDGSVHVGCRRAVTLKDIVDLTKAGLGEDVLLALIEVDGGVFDVDSATLTRLKQPGSAKR